MGALLKKRSFSVRDMSCKDCEEKVQKAILRLPGTTRVVLEYNSGKVQVEYDLLQTNAQEIESAIRESGFKLESSIFQRIKRSLLHFTEENERDNYKAPAKPCCSHPDSVIEKAGKHH